MSSQLDRWRGQFGVDYANRNVVDPDTRVDWYRETLGPLGLKTVLEAGANRGHNLLAMRDALGCEVIGIEPNEYARSIALAAGCDVEDGDVRNIGWPRDRFDLCMTSGVLIHLAPEHLDAALRSLHAASRRYLLSIEYHADEDTPVEYRGHDDMLWKRDYLAHWWRLYPKLELLSWGDLTEADGFAGARYWLLKKP